MIAIVDLPDEPYDQIHRVDDLVEIALIVLGEEPRVRDPGLLY